MLKTTMVTALGEFGRTPKINPAGGRDHHPGVWTILMGGGPIQGGRVVGESDELGYFPKSRPVTPGEVAATLYQGLGLDPHHELPGPQNRPLPLADYSVRADQGAVLSPLGDRPYDRRKASEGAASVVTIRFLSGRDCVMPRATTCRTYGIPEGTAPAGTARGAARGAGGLR